MADFKVCVRNKKKNGMSTVFIRLCHNDTAAYIRTEFYVAEGDLSQSGEVRDAFVLKRVLVAGESAESFSRIAREYVNAMLRRGQRSNARVYGAALKSFHEFMGSEDVKM